jgi:hypothetical protein
MMTASLLLISNILMTLAWYGHLKFKDQPLWLVVLHSRAAQSHAGMHYDRRFHNHGLADVPADAALE